MSIDAQSLINAAKTGDAVAALKLARLSDLNGQHAAGLEWLRRAAALGDLTAKTLLGARLLTGRAAPYAPPQGAQFIFDAARAGHAGAAAYASCLCAAGIGAPQNWAEAISFARAAAERGEARAGQALAALDAAQLGEAGAITAWLAAAPRQVLNEDPYLCAFETFAPAPLAAHMMARAAEKLQPARVYDADSGGRGEAEFRSNTGCGFAFLETDLVIWLLRARIAEAAQVPLTTLEPTNVLHYAPGEQYEPHFDFLNPESPALAAQARAQGQRVKTFLIYLNDDYEGGETAFPELGLSYRGRAGGGFVFHNVKQGQVDPRTLHAGLPPTRGEKWLFSQWIRDRALPVV